MSYFTTKHWLELLHALPPAGAILHASSLRLLAGLDEKAGRQACWRLARAGMLTHLGQGWYTHVFAKPSLAEAAHLLVMPSYASLETVLARRGITTQPSVFHQCVTLQPTQHRRTPLGEIYYRHITRDLFFGFRRQTGTAGLLYLEAEPEKALLDLIYLSRRRGDQVWLDLDFARLDATRFPASVRESLEELRETRVVLS